MTKIVLEQVAKESKLVLVVVLPGYWEISNIFR